VAAQNPDGSQLYWFNGLPFQGVRSASAETTTLTYWFNGLPEQVLFPEEASTMQQAIVMMRVPRC
jgi:hypothetical protein